MIRILFFALTLWGLASAARADPCEGRLPSRAGDRFAGSVRYVGDGDSLCVGRTSNPAEWIEVRLADFNAPELNERGGRDARDRLVRLVNGRNLDCVAERGRSGRVIVFDRVIARCRLNGRQIGDLLRASGGREGGR
ncbi:MAG: thermonuclease family protein [Brevundimonas aurantiaca]|jgi:endonuclease YncB( thermonuclease family)|uniref:thermonuclease family protein n=1 Tax=Brevundimonas TaxID=41275 RepID=UPI001A1CC916|nr:nuclease [Brevundimonas sp.]MBJ7484133.1 nuclease [Brevundimonas sp.]